MSQEIKVVARTFEVDKVAQISGLDTDQLEFSTNDDLTLLAGKAAGVCYMPDDYFENGVQDENKAYKRAEMTAKSGHHSVFDHGHITMVIKTNKMMAMILNSLGVYATSEKSARYTKMQPETELELRMYTKWRAKIQELILAKYPDTDDAELRKRFNKWYKTYAGDDKTPPRIENGAFIHCVNDECYEKLNELNGSDTLPSMKLAMENARYMISVFTPTTMMYTISLRQAFLTIDYLNVLVQNLVHAEDVFSAKLRPYVVELMQEFERVIGTIRLSDNKNQYIRFLEAQNIGEFLKDEHNNFKFTKYDDLDKRIKEKTEVIADSYTVVYTGSLAMLAQAQRHRTLRYTMKLQDIGEYGFYVPEIVDDACLTSEWLNDIKSVSYCIPQGTMVRITEQGLFEDFVLKCKERLCGRAQLEIMKSTAKLVTKFANECYNLSYNNIKLLENITAAYKDDRSLKPCARCSFKDFKCTEGCHWGANKALTRLI